MDFVLVTGGAGYVGSHTCKALAQAGYMPVSYDNLSRGHAAAVRWGPLEIGDIADAERLAQVIRHYQPVAILHFAAYAYVAESVQYPLRYFRNNVGGSLTLIEVATALGIENLVFSSTCTVYGHPQCLPIPEDHPLLPIHPYGISKATTEQMLRSCESTHALRSVCLRYFNAAGADPEGEIGEVHDPEPHLIPNVLRAGLGRIPAVCVHGTDYETPDGSCVRDYIHVSDLAQAHVLALDYLRQGGGSAAFNLSNSRGYSVKEVIATAEQVIGKPIPVVFKPRRPGDVGMLVGAAKRAQEVLGWQQRYADLETIIATAWRWFQQHP